MSSRIFATFAALLLAAPLALWGQVPNNDVGLPVQGPALKTLISNTICATAFGTLGNGSKDLPGVSGVQTGRLFRDGVPSLVAAPKSVPSVFSTSPLFYDSYVLTNQTGVSKPLNMNLYVFPGESSSLLHLAVYAGTFDPTHLQSNYLADSGSSASPGGSGGLSTTLGAGQSVVVVVFNPSSTQTGTPYLLSYDGFCGFFDRSYYDDQGRALICYNSFTGEYQWSIFKGIGAGMTFFGIADVSNKGNTIASPFTFGSTDKLTFYVYTRTNSAYGVFHPAAFGGAIGSVIGDVNILDDPPSDCLRGGTVLNH